MAIGKIARWGALTAAGPLLAACVTLYGLTYDPGIVRELNEYHQNVVAFVSEMEARAGEPAGAYTSPRATEFYGRYRGVLTNLVVRAQASPETQRCPSAGLASLIVVNIGEAVAEAPRAREAAREVILGFDSQVREAQASGVFESGSCTVVVLNAVLANQLALESIHQRERKLIPPVSTLALALVGDSVRIALRNEEAKKPIGATP